MRPERVRKEAPAKKRVSCLRERGEVRDLEGWGSGVGWENGCWVSWLDILGMEGRWRKAMSLSYSV
jgi:hypothetical protein